MLPIKHLDDWFALELNEVFPNKPSSVPPPVSLRAKLFSLDVPSSLGRSREGWFGWRSEIGRWYFRRDALVGPLEGIFKLSENHCAGHIFVPACSPPDFQATGPFR